MADKEELNEHGFKKPETIQLGVRPDNDKVNAFPYTPQPFQSSGQEVMTPQQFVASQGDAEIKQEDWDDEGRPLTEAAYAMLGLAVMKRVDKLNEEQAE